LIALFHVGKFIVYPIILLFSQHLNVAVEKEIGISG